MMAPLVGSRGHYVGGCCSSACTHPRVKIGSESTTAPHIRFAAPSEVRAAQTQVVRQRSRRAAATYLRGDCFALRAGAPPIVGSGARLGTLSGRATPRGSAEATRRRGRRGGQPRSARRPATVRLPPDAAAGLPRLRPLGEAARPCLLAALAGRRGGGAGPPSGLAAGRAGRPRYGDLGGHRAVRPRARAEADDRRAGCTAVQRQHPAGPGTPDDLSAAAAQPRRPALPG